MDCVAVIIATLLSSFQGVVDAILGFLRSLGAEGVGNLFNLQKNADALNREMEALREIRDDLVNKIRNLERQPGMRRTQQASGWLNRLEVISNKVRSLQDSMAGRATFLERCSFDSLHSGCLLGGQVVDLSKAVRELKGERGALTMDSQLVDEAPPDPVVAVPSMSARIVGEEKTLLEIQGHLRDEEVGIIGIYGIGGVGKTTLLKEINNQFVERGGSCADFDVVIWVTISSVPSVYKIQEDIGVRLGFSRREDPAGGRPLPENSDDRRGTLYMALKPKKFLLLLDDMWERLELDEIGVPHPGNGNSDGKKIVFTTRLETVCADMDAQHAKVKVGFLDEGESWELFCSKLDDAAKVVVHSDPDIRPLAETIVRKCGGMPLALITTGRAMSNATGVGEWRQAVEKLRESPDKIRGMIDVLSLLKFSYDRLDAIARECLLYCVLFPEDHAILVRQLLDYWVGEGFLDDNSYDSAGCLHEARDRGDCIIRELKDACLLESVGGDKDGYVKMHDVVREMALWLTTGGGLVDRKKRFVVCGREKGLAEPKTWEDARRISIMQEGATLKLPSLASQCHNLSTLLIGRRFDRWYEPLIKHLAVTQNFCESVPTLRVLDLSGIDVPELPDAIGLLAELRLLNLSYTDIERLPRELGKLAKLRHLVLNDTRQLSHIPREAIVTLTRLQKLEIGRSAYRWNDDVDDDDSGGVKLSDVGCHLVQLLELSLDIRTSSCLDILANSKRLRKCAKHINLLGIADLTSAHLSAALNKMEVSLHLVIEYCPMLEALRMDQCNNLQVGKLKHLKLVGLQQLEIVAAQTEFHDAIRIGLHLLIGQSEDLVPPPFSSLLSLDIHICPKLKDLRWIGQLPRLERLSLCGCEGLEELLVGDEQSGKAADHDDGYVPSSFPKLKEMYLVCLPALRSISVRPLLFPSLELLSVSRCPKLRRLPLGHHSCKKINRIIGEQEWLDALEWDDYDSHS